MKKTDLLQLAFMPLIISCGNSGSSMQTAPPMPVNQAPVFTSSTAETVQENTAGIIYTAQANDPENNSLSYSLVTGQGDNVRFNLDSMSGGLTFISNPDFENPADMNMDNIYDVTIRVSDSLGATNDLSIVITVIDVTENITIRRVGTGFDRPIFLTDLPDTSGRVVVMEQAGRLRLLDPETGMISASEMLDISSSVNSSGNEQGLLGLAFAPDYETSGTLYVNMINQAGETEIRRYSTVSGRTDLIDPLSADIILTISQPFTNHNAGWLGFDNNGFLVIPTGDGGSGGDPEGNAQNTQSLLGKVLRIDVNGDDFPTDDNRDYAIPAGNRFSSIINGLAEIFALGLRNPFRASFDPRTGDLLIGDVGQNEVEEVSRLPMDDSNLNFGWNAVEGTQSFNGGSPLASFTPPVAEYLHGNGIREGFSIAGGYVYAGPVEALQGIYIFSDFVTANIWGIPEADLINGQTVSASEFQILTSDFIPDVGAITNVSSFGTDDVGNLYILDISGDIFRLEAGN